MPLSFSVSLVRKKTGKEDDESEMELKKKINIFQSANV